MLRLFSVAVATPALCALSCVPAFAQADASNAQTLDPFVVTATRSAVRDPAAPTTVISRDEIDRSLAADLTELLRQVAGLEIIRSGGPGQQTSIFLRGTESDHTLLMIDGVRIDAASFTAAVQHIDPNVVERIEIVKGPRAALYGSDAIGGVINVITRDGGQSFGASAHIGGGELGTIKGGIALSGGGVRLAVEYAESDGYPAQRAATVDAGYENTTASLAFDHQFGALGVTASALHADSTTDYFAFGPTLVSQDQTNAAYNLGLALQATKRWTTTLTARYALDDLQQNDSPDFAEITTTAIDWKNDIVTGAHTTTLGVDARQDDVEAGFVDFFSGNLTPYGEQRDIIGVYAQDQWRSGFHDVVVAARYTDDERFGSETTWNADYAVALSDTVRLNLGAGTGFRAPSTNDLFFPGFSNPNLEPETSTNFEVGLRRETGTWRTGITAFRNSIDNLIASDATFTPQNIQRAAIAGIELDLGWQHAAWSTRWGYVVQSATNVTTDEALLRRAPRRLTGQIAYAPNRFGLALDILGVDARPDIDPATFARTEAAGYAVVSLSGQVDIARGLDFTLRVENLLDAEYDTALGFAGQPRSVFGRIGYAF